MDIDNRLTITVYSSGTTPIPDFGSELLLAQAVGFSTFYPGGLHGAASLYVPRDILRWWAIQGAKRIVFRNGMDIVYEGKIDQIGSQVDADAEGMLISANGFWRDLMLRSLRRWYVDTRTGADTWRILTDEGPDEICDIRRQDSAGAASLIFQPRRDAWALNQHYDVTYQAPTGETIKRIEFDWALNSVANEDWTIRFYDVTNAAVLGTPLSRTTTGLTTQTSQSITLSPTSSKIQIQFESDAVQTPAVDGSNNTSYGLVTNLKMYAETGNSGNYADNVDEIGKDLVAEFSTIFNADVTNVDTPASPFAIVPFAPDWETIADILTNAASYGDGASPPNLWGFYLLDSEKAATPNGLPVLALKQYTALTSYDYGVRLTDENLVAPVSITKDYTPIQNWCIVTYQTEDGRQEYITPDDDATLKDATSITDYGQRNSEPLDFGVSNATTAAQLGRRHLAKWKDPQYVLDGPITVQGYILDSNDQPVPACRIQAGKRIRILDYLDDLSGTGLTMHITGTQYEADGETCSITTGAMDELSAAIGQWGTWEKPGELPKPPEKKKRKKKKRKKKK